MRRSQPQGPSALSPSPLSPLFLSFKQSLDASTDQKERIVRCSREITLQSKRLIFSTHRISGRGVNREAIFAEAHSKIQEIQKLFSSISPDLQGQHFFKYHRHISPGLQEFAEAVAFLEYVQHGTLLSKEGLDGFFVGGEEEEGQGQFLPSDEDYILGLADMTGEVMRLCINLVGSGQSERAFPLLQFLRTVSNGFHSLNAAYAPELRKKLGPLDASVTKVEKVCYEIKVRGAEYPEEMLMQLLESSSSTFDSSSAMMED